MTSCLERPCNNDVINLRVSPKKLLDDSADDGIYDDIYNGIYDGIVQPLLAFSSFRCFDKFIDVQLFVEHNRDFK